MERTRGSTLVRLSCWLMVAIIASQLATLCIAVMNIPIQQRRRATSDHVSRSLLGLVDIGTTTTTNLTVVATVSLGSPPTPFEVMIDTGSSTLVVTSTSCPSCRSKGNGYDAAASNTSAPFPCSSQCGSGCTSTSTGTQACSGSIDYVTETVTGYLLYDQLSLAGLQSVDVSFLVATQVSSPVPHAGTFGLAFEASNCIYNNGTGSTCTAPAWEVLLLTNGLPLIFSLCVADQGVLTLGGVDPLFFSGAIVYTPIIDPSVYTVQLLDVLFGSTSFGLPTTAYMPTTVNSGSPYLIASPVVMNALDSLWMQKFGVNTTQCISQSAATNSSHVFRFILSGAVLELPLSDLTECGVSPCSATQCRLVLFNSFKSAVALAQTGLILGLPLMRRYYTIFDQQNTRLGFAPAQCNATCSSFTECTRCSFSPSCQWCTYAQQCMNVGAQCPGGGTVTSSLACGPCALGSDRNPSVAGTNSTQCSPCSPGMFGGGAFSACEPCRAGTYYLYRGAMSPAVCQPCPPGTVSTVLGAGLCLPCAAGTYNNTAGSTGPCAPCPLNVTCPAGTSHPMNDSLYQMVYLTLDRPNWVDDLQTNIAALGAYYQRVFAIAGGISALILALLFLVLMKLHNSRVAALLQAMDFWRTRHLTVVPGAPLIPRTTIYGGYLTVVLAVGVVFVTAWQIVTYTKLNYVATQTLRAGFTPQSLPAQNLGGQMRFYNYRDQCQNFTLGATGLVPAGNLYNSSWLTSDNTCVIQWNCTQCRFSAGSSLQFLLYEAYASTAVIDWEMTAVPVIPCYPTEHHCYRNGVSGSTVVDGPGTLFSPGSTTQINVAVYPTTFQNETNIVMVGYQLYNLSVTRGNEIAPQQLTGDYILSVLNSGNAVMSVTLGFSLFDGHAEVTVYPILTPALFLTQLFSLSGALVSALTVIMLFSERLRSLVQLWRRKHQLLLKQPIVDNAVKVLPYDTVCAAVQRGANLHSEAF